MHINNINSIGTINNVSITVRLLCKQVNNIIVTSNANTIHSMIMKNINHATKPKHKHSHVNTTNLSINVNTIELQIRIACIILVLSRIFIICVLRWWQTSVHSNVAA